MRFLSYNDHLVLVNLEESFEGHVQVWSDPVIMDFKPLNMIVSVWYAWRRSRRHEQQAHGSIVFQENVRIPSKPPQLGSVPPLLMEINTG
jgi:hypothetical protein